MTNARCAIGGKVEGGAGSADHGAGFVADDDADGGGLRGDVGDGHGEHYVVGVVEGQHIGTRVAGFQGNHGFLRAGDQVEDGEAVDVAGGEHLRGADQAGGCGLDGGRCRRRWRWAESWCRRTRYRARFAEMGCCGKAKVKSQRTVTGGVAGVAEGIELCDGRSGAFVHQREGGGPVFFGGDVRHGADQVQAGNRRGLFQHSERQAGDGEGSGLDPLRCWARLER